MHAINSAVDLSLRPERISLSLEKPADVTKGTAFEAVVEESIYLGRGAHVRALAGRHPITIEVTYDEVGGALSRLAKGTKVWLHVRHEDVLLLKAGT